MEYNKVRVVPHSVLERSHLIPEICGSDPDFGNFSFTLNCVERMKTNNHKEAKKYPIKNMSSLVVTQFIEPHLLGCIHLNLKDHPIHGF